ncbi:phosphoglucosamine mutase [Candidatus Marinamargulisbacteria bacterium SCGC AG-343-D04]|nr:phosphoglucosamine mutase [Candidatus Marinamargulisbacteria bacterium SCGC AG-343-D04]
MSSLMVSPSGIRGLVGESLTPELALNVGKSVGMILGKGPIICGGDTRVSYDCIFNAVISGLLAVGTDVISIGKVPTPTVQQAIRKHGAKGGIVVTASHNPIMWNGLKIMNETGSFLDSDQYKNFITHFESSSFDYKSWDKLGVLTEDTEALSDHIDLILEKIDVSAIRESGLKVLIDANNGAGAIANPLLLDQLGIEYKILNREPNGHFAHDPEPLKKNLGQIISTLESGQYDIGFVQDADADRLVILDETGRFIGEDYSLGLCIDYVLQYEKNKNKRNDIVVNLSTSKVIEDIAGLYGGTMHYTQIGEPNVTAKIKEVDAVIGGEGNGGVIYPEIGWGRDSLVGIVLALNYLAKSKKSVSTIVSGYPRYKMFREKLAVNNREDIPVFLNKVESSFNDFSINKEDGVKVSFPTGWVHVRPSNTEPIIRIFIEEQSEERGSKLLSQVLSLK